VVDVLVSGAVVSAGHHPIPAPATVEAALHAAGGLAEHPRMRPAGPVTVRRPLGDSEVEVWRFHLGDPEPQSWRRFELRTGDAVIFQWQVDGV
jgi:hypothetical protein